MAMAIPQDGESNKQETLQKFNPDKQVVLALPASSRDKRIPKCDKRKRSTVDRSCAVVNARVMERAEEVQACLPQGFPSLIKPMVKSHVTGGFWLGLPKQFCTLHLPGEDTMITLDGGSGKEYETKYLYYKTGLSAGWRGFSIAHGLVEGDILVFQLVEPTKFKVYILRANSFDEVDGAVGLLELDHQPKKLCSETDKAMEDVDDDSYWEPLAFDNRPGYDDQNSEDDLLPELLDGIRFSQTAVDFKDMRSIEDFQIVVNGLVIDSELTKDIRAKYYDLCCSQKSFLHEKLIEGLNCKLAAGIISETVNIADAIRASRATTPPEYFSIWERTLKPFADLGMEVGFLRARSEQLMNLVDKEKRVQIARTERASVEYEVSRLEAKILEAKETISKLDVEIGTLEKNKNGLQLIFCELAKAPW